MKSLSIIKSYPMLMGSLLVVAAALAFSTKAVLIKLAYGYGVAVSPIVLMTLRMAIALPLFLVALYLIERRAGAAQLTRNDLLQLIALACVGFYLAAYLDFVGLSYVSASLERLVLLLYPTLVLLISMVVLKRAITLREGVALLVSYAGIVVVFAEELALAGEDVMLGSLLVFGSALAFAIYLVGSGVMVQRMGPMRFTAYAMTIACLATLLHFALDYDEAIFSLPAEVYGLSILMAVVATVIPTFLMNAGIRQIGANPASIISAMGPVATIFLAYLLLDEQLTTMQMAGAMLVVLGITVVTMKRVQSR